MWTQGWLRGRLDGHEGGYAVVRVRLRNDFWPSVNGISHGTVSVSLIVRFRTGTKQNPVKIQLTNLRVFHLTSKEPNIKVI